MSLQTELATFKTSWRERVGAETAKLVDDDNAALQSLAERALKAGAQFPETELPNQIGGTTELGALIASGPLVVTFSRRLVPLLQSRTARLPESAA